MVTKITDLICTNTVEEIDGVWHRVCKGTSDDGRKVKVYVRRIEYIDDIPLNNAPAKD